MANRRHIKDGESVESAFFRAFADRVRETESQTQRGYEIEAAAGDGTERHPIADCLTDTRDGEAALGLVFPTKRTDPTLVKQNDVFGIGARGWQISVRVTQRDRRNGLLTAWVTDPQVTTPERFEGPPTKEHLDYLGA